MASSRSQEILQKLIEKPKSPFPVPGFMLVKGIPEEPKQTARVQMTVRLDDEHGRALRRLSILRGTSPGVLGREAIHAFLYQSDATFRAWVDSEMKDVGEESAPQNPGGKS